MSEEVFKCDGPSYHLADDNFARVYYSRDGKKYKRVRRLGCELFSEVDEEEISNDEFWMVVACIERKPRHATH